jgi:hypothetical protein
VIVVYSICKRKQRSPADQLQAHNNNDNRNTGIYQEIFLDKPPPPSYNTPNPTIRRPMTNTETTPLRATDVFMHLIVTFLTPMFLAAAGGDPAVARAAATETVNAHCARNLADLLPIAQVIAFGLAVLGSLSLSMAEDLSIPLILRLRGNAATLNRGAEQCRRVLRDPSVRDTTPYWLAPDFDPEAERAQEEAVIANVLRATQRVAEVNARTTTKPAASPPPVAATPAAPVKPPLPTVQPAHKPEPQIQPAPAAPANASPRIPSRPATRPTQTAEDAFRRNAWATAMTDVAREYTTDLVNMPPSERREATMRAAALSGVAHQLLSGDPLPPSIFDLKTASPPPRP